MNMLHAAAVEDVTCCPPNSNHINSPHKFPVRVIYDNEYSNAYSLELYTKFNTGPFII